jgi:hypothetical protein
MLFDIPAIVRPRLGGASGSERGIAAEAGLAPVGGTERPEDEAVNARPWFILLKGIGSREASWSASLELLLFFHVCALTSLSGFRMFTYMSSGAFACALLDRLIPVLG